MAAVKTTYEIVKINGEKAVITAENLLFTMTRLTHVNTHQYQLESRVGTPHGIWANDDGTYGNQMMLILSYADRAIRRVRRNGTTLLNTAVQNNGRTAYDVKLISNGSIGTSSVQNQFGGTHVKFTDQARLVVEPAVQYGNRNIIPVVTFFPIS